MPTCLKGLSGLWERHLAAIMIEAGRLSHMQQEQAIGSAEKRRPRPSAKARGLLGSAAYRPVCEHPQKAAQRRITACDAVFHARIRN
jgi:hypothetical protein